MYCVVSRQLRECVILGLPNWNMCTSSLGFVSGDVRSKMASLLPSLPLAHRPLRCECEAWRRLGAISVLRWLDKCPSLSFCHLPRSSVHSGLIPLKLSTKRALSSKHHQATDRHTHDIHAIGSIELTPRHPPRIAIHLCHHCQRLPQSASGAPFAVHLYRCHYLGIAVPALLAALCLR